MGTNESTRTVDRRRVPAPNTASAACRTPATARSPARRACPTGAGCPRPREPAPASSHRPRARRTNEGSAWNGPHPTRIHAVSSLPRCSQAGAPSDNLPATKDPQQGDRNVRGPHLPCVVRKRNATLSKHPALRFPIGLLVRPVPENHRFLMTHSLSVAGNCVNASRLTHIRSIRLMPAQKVWCAPG